MTWPTLTMEVAFAADAVAASPTFTDISDRVLEFSLTRGRNMELDQTEVGQFSVLLDNQDRALDPVNPDSPYYPNVVPVRQARLRVGGGTVYIPPTGAGTFGAGDFGAGLFGTGSGSGGGITISTGGYDLFRGDVMDWPQQWDGQRNTSPVTVLDGFDALQVATFSTFRPSELTDDRVNAILDAIGWPATLRAIDTGTALLQAMDYQSANALQALQDVTVAELGVLFMSPTGVLTFEGRYRRASETIVKGEFSNEPTGDELPCSFARPTFRRDLIINDAHITQAGGATYTAGDTTSQNRYRVRSSNGTRTLAVEQAAEAQSTANYLVTTYKDPLYRIEEITLEPQLDEDLWPHVLGREIGDLIRVRVAPPGDGTATFTSDVIIEGISHHASGADKRWTTVFRCSPSLYKEYWHLGVSHLGVNTRLGH